MEDVFEAFIGVTKLTLVEKFGYMGVGNQIVFNMIKTLMDERNIVLDPEELYDTKTRLKELFDKRDIQNMYGKLKYIYTEKPKTVKIFLYKMEILYSFHKEKEIQNQYKKKMLLVKH